jgi:uncharacterized membrane protein YqjE
MCTVILILFLLMTLAMRIWAAWPEGRRLKTLEKDTNVLLLDAGDIFQGTPYLIIMEVN